MWHYGGGFGLWVFYNTKGMQLHKGGAFDFYKCFSSRLKALLEKSVPPLDCSPPLRSSATSAVKTTHLNNKLVEVS